MRHRSILFLAVAAITSLVLAGGPPSFSFQAPSGRSGTSPSGSVLLVHAFSCHAPTDATVRASAEGVVDGKRRTIPLEMKSTGSTGVYSVARQWPAEGSWVLVFSIDRGGQTTALVKLDGKGMPSFTGSGEELAASSLRTISGYAKERDIASVLVAPTGG